MWNLHAKAAYYKTEEQLQIMTMLLREDIIPRINTNL